jgi:hypothetical protein
MAPLAIESLGMRGYRPVFDEEGKPVLIDGYLMMCERETELVEKRAESLLEHAEAQLYPVCQLRKGKRGHGDGDIVRVTCGLRIWRGVLAIYRYTPQTQIPYESELEAGRRRLGIEFVSQRRGRDPHSVRLGFYKR